MKLRCLPGDMGERGMESGVAVYMGVPAIKTALRVVNVDYGKGVLIPIVFCKC